MARVVDHFLPAVRLCPLGARQSRHVHRIALEAGAPSPWVSHMWALDPRSALSRMRTGEQRPDRHAAPLNPRGARSDGWRFAEAAAISGWRENRQTEGLGFGDHALVVGDERAELSRDACGRGEMDRVERPQRRPADLRRSRDYRLDRKQPQTSKYADGDRGSVTAEAPCGSGDLDRGERLEARSGQRRSSWRSAAVSASIAISLTRAEESRYATGVLLATLTHVARLWAAFNLECRRCRIVRAEIERFDLEQIALCAVNGQLGRRETV